MDFRTNIFIQLFKQYMTIFLNFSPTLSHLYYNRTWYINIQPSLYAHSEEIVVPGHLIYTSRTTLGLNLEYTLY